ncbi:methanogenesis marker 6 protein [Methanosarcinales archaeon]|uniref:Uncharacterized conserved protein UCP005642, methanogenesis n=1 Tax=Candidatus Syntropharchaeum caldarium TaxID=1838285 RepID=A0A1F2P8U8_9EURY|nr:MAG: Uncharacterized conserved protein UCP005642, methanogenesis [Candidatus Syntrophoarchaeum caldarius]RLG34123.1 MAG: methanogenesis marker 6 protein [Methanosarcinales archaeon]
MAEETETRLVMISSDSTITPEQIKKLLSEMNLGITIKDTCFGALIEGAKHEVDEAIEAIRKLDKHGIFTKVRGFPVGDPRVCRATRSGGARPGFHQLEAEYRLLPMIRHALDELDESKGSISWKKKEKFPADKLNEMISSVEL